MRNGSQKSDEGLRKKNDKKNENSGGSLLFAACLAVIFGASFVMSGISRQMVPGISSGYETAATILGGGAAPEYIIIGVLSFLLGVCVTILCFRIRLLNKEEQMEEQKGDNANGTCR